MKRTIISRRLDDFAAKPPSPVRISARHHHFLLGVATCLDGNSIMERHVGATILVIGAAGGVGRALVLQLLSQGHQVLAGARDPAAMADLERAGAKLVTMDVGSTASVTAAFEHADALLAGMPLDTVINCAAVAPVGTVEFTPPEEFGAILNVNTVGALRVLQGALPRLRRSTSGRLILISSLWGRMSGPFVSNYAASKHAIEAIADAARREMGRHGVQIAVVEPGVVATPMFQDQFGEIKRRAAGLSSEERRLYGSMYEDYTSLLKTAERTAISADTCARAIVRQLGKKRLRPRYRIGLDARIAVMLARLLSDAAMDRLFALTFKPPKPST